MTKMGRAMDTTLFVKNGPCMAALGLGGEGYLSFSIATPTGEGVTTPLTFTRERRCSLIDDLRILGKRRVSVATAKLSDEFKQHATADASSAPRRPRSSIRRCNGWKLLVVQPLLADGVTPDGDPVMAIDCARRGRRRDGDDHQRRQAERANCWGAKRRRSAGA